MPKYVLVEEDNIISKNNISDIVTADSVISATSNLTSGQKYDIQDNLEVVRTVQGHIKEPIITGWGSDVDGIILSFGWDEQDIPHLSFFCNNDGEETVLSNVHEPIVENDAATKNYVDNKLTFVVKISYNYQTGYSADKTFAQILEAYNSGTTILGKSGGDFVNTCLLTKCTNNSAEFIYCTYDDEFDIITVISYTVTKNNVWSRVIKRFLPVKEISYDTFSTSVTLDLASYGNVYEYGTLTSLTVTSIDSFDTMFDIGFKIRFISGSTPTTVSFPNTMKFQEAFVPAANTRYEIQSTRGYAIVYSWPINE